MQVDHTRLARPLGRAQRPARHSHGEEPQVESLPNVQVEQQIQFGKRVWIEATLDPDRQSGTACEEQPELPLKRPADEAARRTDQRIMWMKRLPCAVLLLLSAAVASAQSDDEPRWPRTIEHPQAKVVIYEPQLESFKGDKLTARSAVSVTPTGSQEPVFGAVWVDARVATDREERTVDLLSVTVTDVRFPDATDAQKDKLKKAIEEASKTWDLSLSLDDLLTAVELVETEKAAAEKFSNDPPKLVVSKVPAVLVTIDGEPKLQKVQSTSLMRVVNSPFFIVLDADTKSYFLKAGEYWMVARQATGPWKLTGRVPGAAIAVAEGADPNGLSGLAPAPEPPTDEIVPDAVVATEPTELVVLDGEPEFQAIADTNLLYVSNTESDVFVDINTQGLYLLISGRWFTAKDKGGPWTYVPPKDLPADFARIPPASAKGDVLTSVPDTDEAKEAVADTFIPQTSAIKRSEAKVEVTYDGEAKFEAVEGTSMEYAVNTPYSVVKVDKKYYCCNDAVWFEADSPKGAWAVCTSVPQVIYTIPPTCPVYPVKYVYVYDSTPEVVYVGYTPGYLGCYAYGGVVVYGTGCAYRPWYGSVYYPRPVTWGFGFYYNGTTGNWGVGVGVGASRGWVVAGGGSWGAVRVGGVSGGWWGNGGVVVGGRPIATPYGGGIRTGDININRNTNINQGNNIYNRRGDVAAGNRPGQLPAGRPAQLPADRARPAQLPADRSTPSQLPARGTATQRNDLLAGRDGGVYRKGLDGWQPPAATREAPARPAQQPANRMDDQRRKELDSQLRARSRGEERTQKFQQSRPAQQPAQRASPRPAQRPAGGGGGRRR
jgi:hypothetical protein